MLRTIFDIRQSFLPIDTISQEMTPPFGRPADSESPNVYNKHHASTGRHERSRPMEHTAYIHHAMKLAVDNVKNRRGKPYGAVVVQNGKVIGSGTNDVLALHDPTAHAEIQAIRHACEELKSDRLDHAVLYASGEPCPMCLAAMYWAGVREVYYGYTAEEAAEYGFDARPITDELSLPAANRALKARLLPPSEEEPNPFEAWNRMPQ
jgi:guanine deaminase